ncbi:vitamin-D-receptor interacting mediator subunit 4-domain-containing protein [Xylaria sp. CBS 124048]|nr:vitamin-D-receptor interacting mediator subunit 4-domain-containing protein [Xylaria sp. CBS 124048]
MDKQLDVCFDRVEKALGTLIDSIAKYNPSASQVQDLGNADAELTKGLQDLQTHQSNYQRIQALRASTASYDAQIKDTLRLLANTRKELVNATATPFPDGPSYEIKYDELLKYARRISKTTIPPVGAVNAVSTLAESSQARGDGSGGATTVTTPVAETPNGTQAPTPQAMPVAVNGASSFDSANNHTSTTASVSGTELPESIATFLNPNSDFTFVPWPAEEVIRHGTVANLAYLADQGIDIEGYDPEAEKARKELEEQARREAEARERAEREERERRLREEQARIREERERNREKAEAESWRRASLAVAGAAPGTGARPGAGAGASPTQTRAQFQFMGDDDDDDDD